jgi:hypothetical protein
MEVSKSKKTIEQRGMVLRLRRARSLKMGAMLLDIDISTEKVGYRLK